MPVLHLGVLDTVHPTTSKSGAAIGTGDLAKILEAKYHIFASFYDLHAQEIADDLTSSMNNALQDALSGAPVQNYGLHDSEQFIQDLFVKFIDSKEMDGLGIPGVPTAASLRGVNHRLKKPTAKGNPVRPSFKDTGVLENSMRVWIET